MRTIQTVQKLQFASSNCIVPGRMGPASSSFGHNQTNERANVRFPSPQLVKSPSLIGLDRLDDGLLSRPVHQPHGGVQEHGVHGPSGDEPGETSQVPTTVRGWDNKDQDWPADQDWYTSQDMVNSNDLSMGSSSGGAAGGCQGDEDSSDSDISSNLDPQDLSDTDLAREAQEVLCRHREKVYAYQIRRGRRPRIAPAKQDISRRYKGYFIDVNGRLYSPTWEKYSSVMSLQPLTPGHPWRRIDQPAVDDLPSWSVLEDWPRRPDQLAFSADKPSILIRLVELLWYGHQRLREQQCNLALREAFGDDKMSDKDFGNNINNSGNDRDQWTDEFRQDAITFFNQDSFLNMDAYDGPPCQPMSSLSSRERWQAEDYLEDYALHALAGGFAQAVQEYGGEGPAREALRVRLQREIACTKDFDPSHRLHLAHAFAPWRYCGVGEIPVAASARATRAGLGEWEDGQYIAAPFKDPWRLGRGGRRGRCSQSVLATRFVPKWLEEGRRDDGKESDQEGPQHAGAAQ